MHLLSRTKPIKLRFCTSSVNAYELFPPAPAKGFVPGWLSETSHPVRHCYGMRQSFSRGFVIPLWSDLHLKLQKNKDGEYDGNLRFVDSVSELMVEPHDHALSPRNKVLIKLLSPWFCECEEEVTFSVMENMYSNPSRGVEFMSGIMEYRYQNSTNMFLYLPKKDTDASLRAGDTPLLFRQNSERDLVIECKHDPERFDYLLQRYAQPPFLSNRWSQRRNVIKRGLNKLFTRG
jgi:hypothetical protein